MNCRKRGNDVKTGGLSLLWDQREDADTDSVATKIVSLARTNESWSRTVLSLGMSEAQIDEMMATRQVPDVVYLQSPIDGFILERDIAAGQRFERRVEFYRIADLHRMWIICELFNGQERWLRPGERARLAVRNADLRCLRESPLRCRRQTP